MRDIDRHRQHTCNPPLKIHHVYGCGLWRILELEFRGIAAVDCYTNTCSLDLYRFRGCADSQTQAIS